QAVTFVVPYAYGVSGHGRLESFRARPAGGYVGALAIALAAVGVLSRRRERWIFLLYAALGVSMFVGLAPIEPAISRLPLFSISLNHRLVFLAAFGIAALAALGAEEIRQARGPGRFAAFAVAEAALIGGIAWRVWPTLAALGMPRGFLAERVLLQVFPLLLAAAVVAVL